MVVLPPAALDTSVATATDGSSNASVTFTEPIGPRGTSPASSAGTAVTLFRHHLAEDDRVSLRPIARTKAFPRTASPAGSDYSHGTASTLRVKERGSKVSIRK